MAIGAGYMLVVARSDTSFSAPCPRARRQAHPPPPLDSLQPAGPGHAAALLRGVRRSSHEESVLQHRDAHQGVWLRPRRRCCPRRLGADQSGAYGCRTSHRTIAYDTDPPPRMTHKKRIAVTFAKPSPRPLSEIPPIPHARQRRVIHHERRSRPASCSDTTSAAQLIVRDAPQHSKLAESATTQAAMKLAQSTRPAEIAIIHSAWTSRPALPASSHFLRSSSQRAYSHANAA